MFLLLVAGAVRAQQASELPVVGAVPAAGQVMLIDDLGSYGLGPNLPGNRYAVVGGHLVRIDIATGKILSVLRPVRR